MDIPFLEIGGFSQADYKPLPAHCLISLRQTSIQGIFSRKGFCRSRKIRGQRNVVFKIHNRPLDSKMDAIPFRFVNYCFYCNFKFKSKSGAMTFLAVTMTEMA